MRRNFKADLWSQLAEEALAAAMRLRRQPNLKRQVILIAVRYAEMAQAETDAAPREQEQQSE